MGHRAAQKWQRRAGHGWRAERLRRREKKRHDRWEAFVRRMEQAFSDYCDRVNAFVMEGLYRVNP